MDAGVSVGVSATELLFDEAAVRAATSIPSDVSDSFPSCGRIKEVGRSNIRSAPRVGRVRPSNLLGTPMLDTACAVPAGATSGEDELASGYNGWYGAGL